MSPALLRRMQSPCRSRQQGLEQQRRDQHMQEKDCVSHAQESELNQFQNLWRLIQAQMNLQ